VTGIGDGMERLRTKSIRKKLGPTLGGSTKSGITFPPRLFRHPAKLDPRDFDVDS
jgi:hypothetical protein